MAENERLKMALSKGPDTQVTAEVSQYSAQLQEEFLVELQNPVRSSVVSLRRGKNS